MQKVAKFASAANSYFIEPLLLAFAIFILFPHWQSVYNSVASQGFTFPGISRLFSALWGDILMFPMPYIFFGIIFFVWLVIKNLEKRDDNRKEEDRDKLMNRLVIALEKLEKQLEKPTKND